MKLTMLQEAKINEKCSTFIFDCYDENIVATNTLSFNFLKELRKFIKQIIKENKFS